MKIANRRTLGILRLLSDSVLPIIFWVSLIFGFDAPYVAILTIISALLHELGHCTAIYLLSGRSAKLRARSSGFRIRRTETLSYRDEIIILLAGPFVNLAVFFLCLPFGGSLGGYVGTVGIVNLATALSNLMPFEGYDGYGALSELLRSRGRCDLIRRLEVFSFILSTAVTFLSLYLIERFGEGYWIFGLFFITVISKLVNFGKCDIFRE